jgi:HAD superfamily hydrolase (TIGR01490 family)
VSLPAFSRERKLSAFDLDHTLITVNSAFDFALFLFKRRALRLREIIYILNCYGRHKLAGMTIEMLHQKIFKRIFAGRYLREFEQAMEDYQALGLERHFYHPAYRRLRMAQESGHEVAIISSSTQFVVQPFAERLGVEQIYTTEYHADEEGRMSHMQRLIRGQDKAQILHRLAYEYGLSKPHLVAYSDSYEDLPFLESAGTAVAVCPDRRLRRIAQARRWEII